MTGPVAARMVLRDPTVDVAVLETARGGLLRRGMGYRRCNVGACLNVAADHLGLTRRRTRWRSSREVKRIVVEIAQDTAVLNADDVLCLKMADYTTAEHVCYVTMNPTHSLVKAHIQAGGRAAVLEEGITGQMITLYDGGSHIPLLFTHADPRDARRPGHRTTCRTPCSPPQWPSAWASRSTTSGTDCARSTATFFQVPGRMNVFEDHPFQVILDYGHNPAAVRTMVELGGAAGARGRSASASWRRRATGGTRTCRRSAEWRPGTSTTTSAARTTICATERRARFPDSSRRPCSTQAYPPRRSESSSTSRTPCRERSELAGAGDLVLIFGDDIRRCWQQITDFVPGGEARSERRDATERPEAPAPAAGLSRPPVPALDLDGELIRDERGVRLAREEND